MRDEYRQIKTWRQSDSTRLRRADENSASKAKKDDARLRRRKSTAVVCSFFQSQRRTEKERERVFNDLSRSPADEWVS